MEKIHNQFLKLRIDWVLVGGLVPLLLAGLITMNPFTANSESYFFNRQLIWIAVSLLVFLIASLIDWRFLRRSGVVALAYIAGILTLGLLFVLRQATNETYSWIVFGGFSLQPAEFMKILVIIILAKYFTRRHIEIARTRHIIISGLYAFIPFILIFLQPDFGSAMIVAFIWLGMVLVAGISKKHLLLVFGTGALAFVFLWSFVFVDYQKDRIISFIHPLADIQGVGYNAFQSTVAVGSGQILGKGVGYGSQSRLKFLPEPETDFIFASFAEEWGYLGSLVLFASFGVVIWRILANSMKGPTNFEVLFGFGLAMMFVSHFIIHVGMNIGLLPVTGLPMPFVSYGGSHLLAEFLGLGILMGMRKYSLAFHRDDVRNEFIGPQ